MSRSKVRPYLITKSDVGAVTVTVRTTRLNSQGYPLVSSERLDETFTSVSQARLFLRAEHQAEALDIATA